MRFLQFFCFLFIFFIGWSAEIAIGWLFWQVRNGNKMVRNLAFVFWAMAAADTMELVSYAFVTTRQVSTWHYGALYWSSRVVLDLALVWLAMSLIHKRKRSKQEGIS